jgi:hypothetical protein
MSYTRQRYLATSTWQSRKRCKTQTTDAPNGRWESGDILSRILNTGPHRWAGMGDMLDQFVQVARCAEAPMIVRRQSSIYSSGPTSPVRARSYPPDPT